MRVAIAEDNVLLREGIARLLGDEGFEVVALCDDAEELLRKLSSHEIDIVILDIRLPPTHSDEGLRAAIEIRERYPGVAVLVLSQYVEIGLAMKLLADSAEGVGYLLKDRIGEASDFVASVRRWRPAARRSTRSSSRPCSPSSAGTIRSRRSPRASARCSS
jgi:DNA-binding NarL/FixJ family response regulator